MTSSTFASRDKISLPVAVARVDLYATIHKGLRSFMMDTLSRVGQIDVLDADDMAAALGQLEALLDLCASHIEHENAFVHTAIEARMPSGSRRIADEHIEHFATIDELRSEARTLQAATAEQRGARALRLYRHLALFVAENFQHMHVEETAHNAALWTHYTDPELLALHGRLLASVGPQEMLLTARWMVPALNPAERATVFEGMKGQGSPEAFLGLLEHVRPHLDQRAWGKLAAAVGVAQQPGPVNFK